jgi:Proteasome stabiliser
VQLPVNSLLDLWNDPNIGHAVKSFVLIYLEMGVKRCDELTHSILLPKIISGIRNRPQSLLPLLFGLIIPIMANYPANYSKLTAPKAKPGSATSATVPKLNTSFVAEDIQFVMEKLLSFALYSAPVQMAGSALNPSQNVSTTDYVPAGLSKASVNFITNGFKAAWCKDAKQLSELKVHSSNPRSV